jgi:hypothetical protein
LLCKSLHKNGKVENVVKFVKGNLLNGRTFINLALLNEEGQSWLKRTGNAKVHETTFLVPESEWQIEKEYLNPFKPLPLTPDYFPFGNPSRSHLAGSA